MKTKPLQFDGEGSRECYVCKTIDAVMAPMLHQALPMRLCSKCSLLTPMNIFKIKDKAEQKRAAIAVGAPLMMYWLKAKAPSLFSAMVRGSGRQRRKRR